MIQSQLRNCTFRPRSKLKTTICVVFDLDQMEDIRIAEGCLLFPFFHISHVYLGIVSKQPS